MMMVMMMTSVTQKAPFPNMKSFVEFRHAICFQDVRPPSEELLPSIKNLLDLCWHKNPEMRPSFSEIINILDVIMIDAAIRDNDGRELWKSEFLGRDDIPFDDFLVPFKTAVGRDIDPKERECLKLLLGKTKESLISPSTLVVNIEVFGSILDSFGPFSRQAKGGKRVTIMDRVCFSFLFIFNN